MKGLALFSLKIQKEVKKLFSAAVKIAGTLRLISMALDRTESVSLVFSLLILLFREKKSYYVMLPTSVCPPFYPNKQKFR